MKLTEIKAVIRSFTLLNFLILCSTGCTDDIDDNRLGNQNPYIDVSSYFSMSGWPEGSTLGELNVGYYYGGGVIIYLDSTGQHGIIASMEDLEPEVPWWNGEFIETNASSPSDGLSNTEAILWAFGSEAAYAARLCSTYEIDGYDDWFLPSKEELNLIFANKDLFENIPFGLYWSSTEHELGVVWVQDFSTGEQHLNNSSDLAGVKTRAIRIF